MALNLFAFGLPSRFSWSVLNIGAGGQIEHLDIADDGTMVIGTDVGGGYVWATRSGVTKWWQLATSATITLQNGFFGCWDVAICHGNSNVIGFVMTGDTYISSDKGLTFTRASFPTLSGASPNGGGATDSNHPTSKFSNQHLAFDPANPDVIYLATNNNGIQFSNDRGVTQSQVAGITASSTAFGGAGICFDSSGGTTTISGQTRTKNIFVPSYGNGVWKSTDGGVTWTKLTTGTGPTQVWTAQVVQSGTYAGTYWCSDQSKVWTYTGGTWAEVLGPSGVGSLASAHAVAVDPRTANSGRVIILTDNGRHGWETQDNGATLNPNTEWFGSPSENFPLMSQAASDIPWLATTDLYYMTLGDAKFDPTDLSTAGSLVCGAGIGVFKGPWPKTFAGFTYTSQSLGIEELVANDVIAPSGSGPIVAVWDRGIFVSSNNAFPSTYLPDTSTFVAGWALDYASSDNSYLVGVCDWIATTFKSMYSTDSGTTWSLFADQSPDTGKFGGAIAAASPTKIVWLPANNQVPYYSTSANGGSWAICQLASGGALPTDGWTNAYYNNAHPVAADRVTIGNFYLFNWVHGVYRSANGGATWTLVSSSTLGVSGSDNPVWMRATPGVAGDVWFCSPLNSLQHSTDGGANWSAVANVVPSRFGFGKAKQGNSYPAIYMVGTVSSVYSVWRSDDTGATWTNLGANPNNSLDSISCINGDMNTWGTCYVGFGGTGFVKGSMH